MSEFCGSCGAKVMKYKHGLVKGLAYGLRRLAEMGGGPINLNELNLSISQQTNFYKLRYWGLVMKASDGNEKGGEWQITDLGYRFIRGEIFLSKYAWSFRGHWICFEGPEIYFDEISDGYQYRPDFAREAQPWNHANS